MIHVKIEQTCSHQIVFSKFSIHSKKEKKRKKNTQPLKADR